jgi:hypothetical protein
MMMEDEKQIELQRRVAQAVRVKDWTGTSAWGELDLLSSNTGVDTVETFEQEVRIHNNGFDGPITWHVTLEYGPKDGEGPLTTSESFPGTFQGHFDGEDPVVDDMTVDTSSFYA